MWLLLIHLGRKSVGRVWPTSLSNPVKGFGDDVHSACDLAVASGGRAILAIPPGNLFRGGREQALRQMLLEQHTVDAVVALPAGVFQPYTSIASCLLMLRKGGTTKSVRMVDLSSDKRMQSAKAGMFHCQDEIVSLVRGTQASRYAWDVDVEALAELDFDLTPKRRNQSQLSALLSELPDEIAIKSLHECCEITTGRPIPTRDLLDVPSVDAEGLAPVAEISSEIAKLQARVNELMKMSLSSTMSV